MDDSQEDRTGGRCARRATGLGECRIGSADRFRRERRGRTCAVQHEAEHAAAALSRSRQAARRRRLVAERRGLDLRGADHVDVGRRPTPRRAPTSPTRASAPAAASRRSMRRRSTSARATRRCSTPSWRPPRAGRSCTSRSCSARSRSPTTSRASAPGLNFDGPTIGKIYTGADHEVERPGDQGAESEGEPARRVDRGRPPLGRLGHHGRVHRLPHEDEPGLGREAGRRRQVVRQDGRLAGRHRRQGQRRRVGAGRSDRGRHRLPRAAVRDLEQADLRQRQEQARHVHQALRRDDERSRPQDLVPARHAHEPDVARRLADRLPDHGHRRSRSSTRTRRIRPRPRRS